MDAMAIQNSAQRWRMLTIYTSLTLIIMIIEIIFRPKLFSLSAELIIYLQSTLDGVGYKWFFKIISGFGTPILLVPTLLIIYASEIKKFLAIKFTLYLCFVGYVVSVMKATYSNPRPYWIYPYIETLSGYTPPGIIPFETYAEYGNPSGHSFLVTSFYGYLYYIFLYKKAKKTPGIGAEENSLSVNRYTPTPKYDKFPPEESEMQDVQEMRKVEEAKNHLGIEIQLPEHRSKEEVKTSPFYPICKAAYFTVMFLICCSRMYLGMHSLNQVLLGLTLGGYSLFIIIYYIDPVLDVFLKKVKSRNIQNRGTILTVLTIAYVILTIIPILLFLKNEADAETEWTVWWPVVSAEINPPKFTFAHIKCFMDCGVLGIAYGAFIALMVVENNYLDKGLRIGAITKLALLLRILIFLITTGVFGAVFYLIPLPSENWILTYLIRSNFAACASTYAAIHIAPKVYATFGLEADRYFHHPRELHIDHSFSI